jgi:hypothetical protein
MGNNLISLIHKFQWLTCFKNAVDSAALKPDDEDLKNLVAKFKAKAEKFSVSINVRSSEGHKVAACYQQKENEESDAVVLGHSLLAIGRSLHSIGWMVSGGAQAVMAYMKQHEIKWGTESTKLSLPNCRTTLRIVRRLSESFEDVLKPGYKNSALYFWEQNEQFWGRHAPQTYIQENMRNMDLFQAALPCNDDLRIASENFHIMTLRGKIFRPGVREVAIVARQMVLINKVPQTLIPMFPKYTFLLKEFLSFKEFHKHYPIGCNEDGTPATNCKELPSFAQPSLDKLTQDIIFPVYLDKKVQALQASGGALDCAFVKASLPDIKAEYELELAGPIQPTGAQLVDITDGDDAMSIVQKNPPVEEREAKALENEWSDIKKAYFASLAEKVLSKCIPTFLKWSDGNEVNAKKMDDAQLMQDFSIKIAFFNAGCDCTQFKKAGRRGLHRMVAGADQQHITFALTQTVKFMSDKDTGIFITGRNATICKEMHRAILGFNPKLGVKQQCLHPNEQEFASYCHLSCANAGSVDPSNDFYQIWKSPATIKSKGTPRRFLSGNSAYKNWYDVPIMMRADQPKCSEQVHADIFKNVSPSDTLTAPAPPIEDAPTQEEEEDAPEDDAVTADQTPFPMELHAKVQRAI